MSEPFEYHPSYAPAPRPSRTVRVIEAILVVLVLTVAVVIPLVIFGPLDMALGSIILSGVTVVAALINVYYARRALR